MKRIKTVFLLIGAALLAVIVYQTDLGEVWARLRQVGGWGILAILGVYLVRFVIDTAAWLATLPGLRRRGLWLYRLWKLRMVGSAFNKVTPLASLGGEPVKAAVLKEIYGIGYRQGTASLVLAKTTQTIALVIFLCAGFALTFATEALPPAHRFAAGVGLVSFSTAVVLFYLTQRHRLFSRFGGLLGRGRLGRRLSAWLDPVRDVEDLLVAFYTRLRPRFALATGLCFVSWMCGVVEVYLALSFLGHPVSFADAFILEAVTVLVVSALFFVPANLGTQEGAIVVICAALTGSPALGLALSVIRRFREIVWVLWGLYLGWFYAVDAKPVQAAPGGAPEAATTARGGARGGGGADPLPARAGRRP